MKQYIWLTISMILTVNMCKSLEQPTNTASETLRQAQEEISRLQQHLQKKYPQLNIPPLKVVPDKDLLSAQLQQESNSGKQPSPFHEDFDDMISDQAEETFQAPEPIIVSESILQHDQEDLEKLILRNVYLQRPSAIAAGKLSSAAINTATAYTLCFANIFRAPSITVIPNATIAKTFKCLAIPLFITGTLLSHQKQQAQNFVQQHYQPDPLTARQQAVKNVYDEFTMLRPETQKVLVQTHISTQRMLELAQ